MTAPDARRKVLYLAGWRRSRRTILSGILGQLPGFFSAGEIYYIWHHAQKDAVLSGCGHLPRLRSLERGDEARVRRDRSRSRQDVAAGRRRPPDEEHAAFRLRRPSSPDPGLSQRVRREHRPAVHGDSGHDRLRRHRRLVEVAAVRAAVERKLPFDVYVLHLVRDPRAVAYSWQRRQSRLDRGGGAFKRRTSGDSSARWLAWNTATEAYWARRPDRYLFVRYEDFVAEPAATFRLVLDMLGRAL